MASTTNEKRGGGGARQSGEGVAGRVGITPMTFLHHEAGCTKQITSSKNYNKLSGIFSFDPFLGLPIWGIFLFKAEKIILILDKTVRTGGCFHSVIYLVEVPPLQGNAKLLPFFIQHQLRSTN